MHVVDVMAHQVEVQLGLGLRCFSSSSACLRSVMSKNLHSGSSLPMNVIGPAKISYPPGLRRLLMNGTWHRATVPARRAAPREAALPKPTPEIRTHDVPVSAYSKARIFQSPVSFRGIVNIDEFFILIEHRFPPWKYRQDTKFTFRSARNGPWPACAR